jgi:hypothetical protein
MKGPRGKKGKRGKVQYGRSFPLLIVRNNCLLGLSLKAYHAPVAGYLFYKARIGYRVWGNLAATLAPLGLSGWVGDATKPQY